MNWPPIGEASFVQLAENQGVESIALHGEQPAQMNPAMATQYNLPGVSGKPGEFQGGSADHLASGGFMETTQFEHYASRIKKGMGVGTAHLNLLVPVGNHTTAGTTADGFERFGSPQPLLFSGGQVGSSLLETIPPQEHQTASCQLHCNRRLWPQSLP